MPARRRSDHSLREAGSGTNRDPGGPEGRGGGSRTPNRRFWKPVLFQLSYAPAQASDDSRPRRHLQTPMSRGQVRPPLMVRIFGMEKQVRRRLLLARLAMHGVLALLRAVLAEFESTLLTSAARFDRHGRPVVEFFTLRALEPNPLSHRTSAASITSGSWSPHRPQPCVHLHGSRSGALLPWQPA